MTREERKEYNRKYREKNKERIRTLRNRYSSLPKECNEIMAETTHMKLRILQLSKGLNLICAYDSIEDAERSINVTPRKLYEYCRRPGETLEGYIWMAH